VHPWRETSTHNFSCWGGGSDATKKRTETRYAELVFLHLVGCTCHVVCSISSRVQNVDALFIMLGGPRVDPT
jgi:hypothetical protein